jgi:diacylglycerol kinase (ATP)
VVRTCIIFNPAARGEKARHFRRHLEEIGARCALKQTAAVDDARRLAADAAREGYDIVAAAGGDGTINEVLNGIADVPDGLGRVRLGVVPLGTVNVFARELGIPRQFEPAWQCLLRGGETRIDLPMVEYRDQGTIRRRYFSQLAGAGLDALAIERVRWKLKKHIGPIAYVVAGLEALLRRASRITVTGGEHSAAGELILIGNGKLYGGAFRLFPDADLRDGLLDACVFPRAGWWTLARVSPALLLRGELPRNAAGRFRSPAFTLTSAQPAGLQVDGELIGRLPATFSVQRSGLRVIVPA